MHEEAILNEPEPESSKEDPELEMLIQPESSNGDLRSEMLNPFEP
jgi:hypothetical protein